MTDMPSSWAESAVSFFKTGGHDHDGINSSKIDLSKYDIGDIAKLRRLLNIRNPEEILHGNPDFPDGAIIHGTFIGPGSGVPGANPAGICHLSGGVYSGTGDTPNSFCDPTSGIHLATGVLIDGATGETQVYIDVIWGPVDPANIHSVRIVQYEVEIVESGAGATLAPIRVPVDITTCRFIPVRPGVSYGIRVRAIDNMGHISDYLPPVGTAPPHDYAYITAGSDTTPPADVTGVTLGAGFQSATAAWDDVPDADVAHGAGTYHVQLASDSGFTSIVYDIKVSGLVAGFTKLDTGTQYWVRVKAIDTSDNESVNWSASATDTTIRAVSHDLDITMGGANALDNSSFEIDGTTTSANPSNTDPADGIPDHWYLSGSNTLAFDTTTKYFQSKSIKVTYVDNLTLISQDFSVPVDGNYVISAWLYIPSAWTGGAISIALSNFSGASLVESSHISTTATDQWVRVWATYSIGSDHAGTFKVVAASATASQFIYIDACQVEFGDVLTAYSPRPNELTPGSIKEVMIGTDSITADKIVADAIVAGKIAADAVTANTIAAGAVIAGKIQAGSISSDRIDTTGLDAAVIKFGTMSGDRITANTLDVNTIKSSTISAAVITVNSSGVLRTGTTTAPYHYLIMDANGLRFFTGGTAPFTGGANTAYFDVTSGDITVNGDISGSVMYTGTIEAVDVIGAHIMTDLAPNRRAEMLSSGIRFYPGYDPSEVEGVLWTDTTYDSATYLVGYLTGPHQSGNAAPTLKLVESNTAWGRSVYPLIHVSGADFRVDGNTDTVGQIKGNSVVSANNMEATSYDGPSGAAGVLNSEGGTNKVKFGWTGGGTPHFRVYIDGTQQLDFTGGGSSKTFIIDHPVFPYTKHLIHATVEGPENAVFYRGEGRVVNGVCTITLPYYFEKLTQLVNRTVQITPIFNGGGFTNYQLAASEVRNGKFFVYSDNRELSQNFYWEVKAVRKDVPDLIVEPGRDEVEVYGDGPYKHYVVK